MVGLRGGRKEGRRKGKGNREREGGGVEDKG